MACPYSPVGDSQVRPSLQAVVAKQEAPSPPSPDSAPDSSAVVVVVVAAVVVVVVAAVVVVVVVEVVVMVEEVQTEAVWTRALYSDTESVQVLLAQTATAVVPLAITRHRAIAPMAVLNMMAVVAVWAEQFLALQI